MSQELILSPADPEWHQRRRAFVGASEVAMLFGLPTFGGKTIADLWWQKKYGNEREWNGNASTKLGNRLESAVLEAAEERLGTPIIHRQHWLTKGSNAATLDGRAADSMAVVEAKTAGIIGPSRMADFGDDGSDDVPENYLLQVQCALMVTGAELGYLAALIGGRGFAMFTITPHTELQRAIAKKSAEFIASLSGDVAPPEPPQLDTLKRIRRQPNKVATISDELYDRFESAKADAKASEAVKEEAQRAVLAAMGDAEMGVCGIGAYTFYEQTTNYKAKEASQTTFRVLRFKKA